MRRSASILIFFSIICLFILSIQTLNAQTYPSHPIQIIVPFDPGSAADTAIRPFADRKRKNMESSRLRISSCSVVFQI